MSPTIQIKGPVLLLMGPIGSFFARVADYLEGQGVEVWKVRFPLWEPGFRSNQCIAFDRSIKDNFASFLQETIETKAIRHILMYGDFILPHRIAIQIAKDCQNKGYSLEAWVFELGYLRPNYVTLEQNGVNLHSNLNKPANWYRQLPEVEQIPQARRDIGPRWRKAWKTPVFIQHAFTDYQVSLAPHKLQPKPSYIAAQILGFLRKYQYQISERPVRANVLKHPFYFLVVLQVSTDSQLQHGSPYDSVERFLEVTIQSFASEAPTKAALFIKHHPRDRGYNNYTAIIQALTRQHGVEDRVHYFHDLPLGRLFRTSRGCQGCVLINSSVAYQALFHGIPLKVVGQAPFNLEGLADRQPLENFWKQPKGSDRGLFRKFYLHTLTTTQINGNFDGYFPFSTVFLTHHLPVADQVRSLSRRSAGKLQQQTSLWWPRFARLSKLVRAYGEYSLHWIAWLFNRPKLSKHLFERSARTCLKALGVTVLLDRHDAMQSRRAEIHIANHDSPLDVLLIHGHFRMPAATTAQLHLRWMIPGFRHASERYGHLLLDYRCLQSRLKTLLRSKQQLAKVKQLFIFPSGSLQTPIQERFSSSVAFLALQQDAVIIPWQISYLSPHINSPDPPSTNPMAVLRERLVGPQITVICREFAPVDPRDYANAEALTLALQKLYQASSIKHQAS
jgi:capsular polysaccharide export protein